MSKDQGIITMKLIEPPPPLPYCKMRGIFIELLKLHILFKGRSVDQLILLSANLHIQIQIQGMEILDDFLSGLLADSLPVIVRDLASVAVPQAGCLSLLQPLDCFISVKGSAQRPKHHILMVSQEHFHIWHLHQFTQNPYTVWVSVDHITQHIQGILRLQLDLLHDGVEPAYIAVDI